MYSSVLKVCHKPTLYVLLLGVFIVFGLINTSQSAHAVTGINQQMNFQGRLLNAQGAVVPDGNYNIQFKIYQDGDGLSLNDATGSPAGSLKWTETHLNSSSTGILVKNGYLSVELGAVNPLTGIDWNQSVLWLSINVGNTNASCSPFSSCTPDNEMLPMKRLSATPYAINAGLLGGMSSAQFLQLAQGVQTDAGTNTNSIYLNKTSTGNFLNLQASSTTVFTLGNAGDILLGANANHTLSVAASAAGVVGKSLTISAGSTTNSGAGAAGGDLVLQGGNAAGIGNNNGGNVNIKGGVGTGTGASGIVNIGASGYTTATNAVCAADCTITQANVDNYGTVMVNASTASIIMTLPAPTNTAAGRVLNITSPSGSQDFVLTMNTGTDIINVAMRQNTTASMAWNGTAWTAGGASNATTLQAAYNNGSNPSTVPEIKLDSTRSTIDIQDADVSIGADLLNIHGSNSIGLGTVLFGVSNTGRVSIQGTSDQYSAFRVLNTAGNYLFNINSSNNYVFSNSIKSPNNEIANQGFETGGSISAGEEGWFGSAQASIVNDAANAYTGNYELQVLPNGTNLDVFSGSFFEVKPGDNLYFEGYVKNSAGANGTAGIQISWYNKDKSVFTYTTNYSSLPGTSYALRKLNAVVPASAYFARVSATVRSTANSGTFYFDDFYMRQGSESADMTFRNSADSTTAFRIQSAQSAQTLFTANTTNNILKVGDSTGSDTATTLLVLDSTTTDPTTNLAASDGALFYRSDNNSLKAIIGGAVVDVCTTAVTCTGYSASAGSSVQLQGTSPGTAQTGNFNISGTGIMSQLQTQDTSGTVSNNLVIRTGNATGSTSGNLTLDVGTATTRGTISIGHSETSVATTMYGTLKIQGSNSLTLGTNNSTTGSILFNTSAGTHTISLVAPGTDPTSSYSLTLPQVLGVAGDCMKDTGSGVLGFSDCAAGVTVTLQNAYDNSSPANITLANAKDFSITSQQAATPGNIIFDLQCTTGCTTVGAKGRFAVQNGGGTDIFSVQPNGLGIFLNQYTQIGKSVTDATQVNFQLDSSNLPTDTGACTTTVNQGAMYYNTSMGSIRSCINGSWADVSNPDTLGLLTFGIVPSSGGTNNAYDLPSLIINGVSGPCRVSWASQTSVSIQPCVAYSAGRRVNVGGTTLTTNSATTGINLTTGARWGHICLSGTNNQPVFTTTTGETTATTAMPTFSTNNPILCIADVQGSATLAGVIDNIYDVRTFTSTIKEAVNTSTPSELGMLVDAGTSGAVTPAVAGSNKLYGLVVATDGGTSAGAPNTIIATVGSGWVKANAGTAGQFVKTSATNGYGNTVIYIPNNSFYYSAGNTRTTYSTTCSSASDCSGSLYVNFIVR